MRRLFRMWAFFAVLPACFASAEAASAASVGFADFAVLRNTIEVVEPFRADEGTLTSPDTVTLRIPAAMSGFAFRLDVTGEAFSPGIPCGLDWGGEIGAPAAVSQRVLTDGGFVRQQTFEISKAALGIEGGGTQVLLYRLLATQPDAGAGTKVERCLRATFMAENSQTPSLVVTPNLLDGNAGLDFSWEIDVSSSTEKGVSDLRVSRTSWNGLTLQTLSTGKISIKGRPLQAGNETFTVSGRVGGTAATGTFSIRILEASAYALRASPTRLSFTTNANATGYVTVTSASGSTPTGLAVDISSWNGLTIGVAGQRIAVSGTPGNSGTQTVTISGRVEGNVAVPVSFTIGVFGSEGDEEDDGGGGSCDAGPSVGLVPVLLLLYARRKK